VTGFVPTKAKGDSAKGRTWEYVRAVLVCISFTAAHWVLCRIVWELHVHLIPQNGATFGDFYGLYYHHSAGHHPTRVGALVNSTLLLASLPVGVLAVNAILWKVPSARRAYLAAPARAGAATFVQAHKKLMKRAPLALGALLVVALLFATTRTLVT
jgi:hypothetical protein